MSSQVYLFSSRCKTLVDRLKIIQDGLDPFLKRVTFESNDIHLNAALSLLNACIEDIQIYLTRLSKKDKELARYVLNVALIDFRTVQMKYNFLV